jgi:hypothetical protein
LISLALQQGIIRDLSLSLSASYNISDYLLTSATGATESRSDETGRVRAALTKPIFRRGILSFSYQHVENISDQEGFGFSSDQFSANIGYSF